MRESLQWYKTTIACFRLSEVANHFTDEGFDVSPILVVRDVRAVFNSLLLKDYGRNGTTADDPPLRLRLRRFRDDFDLAMKRRWPVVRFEDLYDSPEPTLRRICQQLHLPWDPSMVTWGKRLEDIADARHGNDSFMTSRGNGLIQSLRIPSEVVVKNIPASDLDWLESEFADLNRAMHYPPHLPRDGVAPGRAVPTYEVTRRAWRERKRGILTFLTRSHRPDTSRTSSHPPNPGTAAATSP